MYPYFRHQTTTIYKSTPYLYLFSNLILSLRFVPHTVIEVHNKSALKAIIKFVSVTSSQVNSKSSGVTDGTKTDTVINGITSYVNTQNMDDVDDDFF